MGYSQKHAFLVGHPGPPGKILRGVDPDLQNMTEILQSPRGGGWRPDEITVLRRPSKAELVRVIRSFRGEYARVYFTGHGTAEPMRVVQDGRFLLEDWRWLCINPRERIRDVDLISDFVPRMDIICDCCRSRAGDRIGGIPEVLERIPYDQVDLDEASSIFDQFVTASPPGVRIIHSTLDGKPSRDDEEGGKFTLALLDSLLGWRTGRSYGAIHFEEALERTRWALGSEELDQVPCIAYQIGNINVPLGIESEWPWGVPQIRSTPEIRSTHVSYEERSPSLGRGNAARPWIIAGAFLFAALWLGRNE